MMNALTFDVEEYFHAEVFAGVVRREEWAGLESRVVRATQRILDVLEEGRSTAATFFVLGWVAARHPELVRMIHARGHEVACHGYSHEMITRQSSTQFAEDVVRSKKTLGHDRGGGNWLSGPDVLGCSGDALEPRGSGRGGLSIRLEHFPDRSRSVWDSNCCALPTPVEVGFRDRDRRVSAFDGNGSGVAHPGGGWRVFPAVSVPLHAMGDPTDQRA